MAGKAGLRLLAASPAAIPYRTAAPVPVGNLVVAGLVTMLALAVLVGVLVYLRRRGWAGEWLAGRRAGHDRGIELRASRRLGASATVHVIFYQGTGYLVVENGRGSTASVLTLGASSDGTTGAP